MTVFRSLLHSATRRVALLLVGGLVAWDDGKPPVLITEPTAGSETRAYDTERGRISVTALITGLEHPWGLAFLPDGRMLLTERPGRVRIATATGEVSPPLRGIPKVFVDGQSGLLDVAVSPTFSGDQLVYLSYGEPNARGNKAGTAVARGRLVGLGLEGVEVIYRQQPKLSSGTHVGSRLVFDDDGYLFVTQGENRQAATAQELGKLQGKLVRIRPDGTVPSDNPFVGKSGARPEIWSYGHRNMQGRGASSADAQALDTRARSPRRRRDQRPGARQELRLARHHPRARLLGQARARLGGPRGPRHGAAAPRLAQVPGRERNGVLHGRSHPVLEGQPLRRRARAARAHTARTRWSTVVHEERLLSAKYGRIRDVRQGPDGCLYLLVDDANGSLLRVQAE